MAVHGCIGGFEYFIDALAGTIAESGAFRQSAHAVDSAVGVYPRIETLVQQAVFLWVAGTDYDGEFIATNAENPSLRSDTFGQIGRAHV